MNYWIQFLCGQLDEAAESFCGSPDKITESPRLENTSKIIGSNLC